MSRVAIVANVFFCNCIVKSRVFVYNLLVNVYSRQKKGFKEQRRECRGGRLIALPLNNIKETRKSEGENRSRKYEEVVTRSRLRGFCRVMRREGKTTESSCAKKVAEETRSTRGDGLGTRRKKKEK